MTARSPAPDARSELGKAAGISGVALGGLVAIAVAALFLLVTGWHDHDDLITATGSSTRPGHALQARSTRGQRRVLSMRER